MSTAKKAICKGGSAPVSKPVLCKSCGITSHPGNACFQRCHHHWHIGKLLDCEVIDMDKLMVSAPLASTALHDDDLFMKIQHLFRSELSKLETNIKELKSHLNCLTVSLDDLKNRVNNLETTYCASQQDLISEMQERIVRSHNIMFFNVEESDSRTEKSAVLNIIQAIRPSDYPDLRIIRLGKSKGRI
ncbi:hypothetical protein KPH14_007664 [Odynerus spinipes]|uniref:Uncharacterized protein n=1 Tax=Odynerus spinipes TaxID=1348599 RepID=A0AAD9R8V6_9HYME|nr:hypothetical protein KPH14_007664 [Odynerus spinipes]